MIQQANMSTKDYLLVINLNINSVERSTNVVHQHSKEFHLHQSSIQSLYVFSEIRHLLNIDGRLPP